MRMITCSRMGVMSTATRNAIPRTVEVKRQRLNRPSPGLKAGLRYARSVTVAIGLLGFLQHRERDVLVAVLAQRVHHLLQHLEFDVAIALDGHRAGAVGLAAAQPGDLVLLGLNSLEPGGE